MPNTLDRHREGEESGVLGIRQSLQTTKERHKTNFSAFVKAKRATENFISVFPKLCDSVFPNVPQIF